MDCNTLLTRYFLPSRESKVGWCSLRNPVPLNNSPPGGYDCSFADIVIAARLIRRALIACMIGTAAWIRQTGRLAITRGKDFNLYSTQGTDFRARQGADSVTNLDLTPVIVSDHSIE